MNYTPNDLQNLELKKALFGGYDGDMVDELLDRIIEDYNSYLHENIQLKDKIAVLNEGIQHYKNIEESLQNALLVAQQTGEEIKKNSYDKADNIIKEAELKAQNIIKEANEDATKARLEYEEVKKNLFVFKAKLEAMLSSQLELIKQIEE